MFLPSERQGTFLEYPPDLVEDPFGDVALDVGGIAVREEHGMGSTPHRHDHPRAPSHRPQRLSSLVLQLPGGHGHHVATLLRLVGTRKVASVVKACRR